MDVSGHLQHGLFKIDSAIIDSGLITGMEVYSLRPSFLEVIPEPLLAGVIGGVCFLFLAIVLSLVTACYMSHRKQQRRRKKRQGQMCSFFLYWSCSFRWHYHMQVRTVLPVLLFNDVLAFLQTCHLLSKRAQRRSKCDEFTEYYFKLCF